MNSDDRALWGLRAVGPCGCKDLHKAGNWNQNSIKEPSFLTLIQHDPSVFLSQHLSPHPLSHSYPTLVTMKTSLSFIATFAALAATVSSNALPKDFSTVNLQKRGEGLSCSYLQPIQTNSDPVNTFGLPADGLDTNGVHFGFLPSDGSATSPKYTMAQINAALGATASTCGWYSQISSTTYDGSQLTEVLSDVVKSGAVFQPAVMPTLTAGFGAITTDVANQVAAVMKQFTDQGVEVWLRFGHEMNWYTQPVSQTSTSARQICRAPHFALHEAIETQMC